MSSEESYSSSSSGEHEEEADLSEHDFSDPEFGHAPQHDDDDDEHEEDHDEDDPLSRSEHAKKLESLSREVKDAYDLELKDTCKRLGTDDLEATASRNKPKKIRDLVEQEEKKEQEQKEEQESSVVVPVSTNNDTTAETKNDNKQEPPPELKQPSFLATSSPTIKLDVMQAWKELLAAMMEQDVFLDYIESLTDAFREVNERCAPVSGSEDESQDTLWFRHQWNLTHLLTHTVKNHQRDKCTECRFVTLLEIALSYQSVVTSGDDNENGDEEDGSQEVVQQWKPSRHVQRFWVRLQQHIEPDIAPVDFRRKAYGVLVSLSWVPSSKGLLEACSIADNRPLQLPPATPLGAQEVLHRIPLRPLPRNDSVYQVLDRLKDETNVSVVISGSKNSDVTSLGIGKTTVAALVASHHLILRSFKVFWLKMDYKRRRIRIANQDDEESEQGRLTYIEYIEYLDELCDQLGLEEAGDNDDSDSEDAASSAMKRPTWPEKHFLKRLEEPSIRQQREESMMREAQCMMTEVLENASCNILLVLDDASEDNELQWFHFIEKQSVLATSQTPIMAADWTVELDPWGEEEATALFLLETDYLQPKLMTTASEVKEIVARCHYHPLVIRTVARWFKLKKVTSGLVTALEEAHSECISDAGAVNPTTGDSPTAGADGPVVLPRVLTRVLGQALSPMVRRLGQPSMLFRLCLSSMAAVFAEFQPVPLSAVMLLWEQLFTMEPDAMEECGGNINPNELRKRVWFIAEGLSHMGLLSFSEDESGDAFVSIHHDMFVKYGLMLVSSMDLGEDPMETRAQWHKAFVAAYLTRKFEGTTPESCQHYALQQLPTHMLYCKLYEKTVGLLANGRLFQERIDAFGRENATILHVNDCVQLMKNIRCDPDVSRVQREEIITEHFQKIAMLLTDHVDASREKAAISLSQDIYSIGFALAENKRFAEARVLYESAQKLVPKSNSFVATILYGLGSVNLILNEPAKAMKNCMASIACMKILGEVGGVGEKKNRLYQEILRLQGQALTAQCSYKAALSHYEEILEQIKDEDSFGSRLEYGAILYEKGQLHQVMGESDKAKEVLNKCIESKTQNGESGRHFARVYSVLGDIYLSSGKTADARRVTDLALKTIQEADAKWPQTKYGDYDDDSDVETKLLLAKLRSLRPDLPKDWTAFDEIREKILEKPVLLMDKSAYDLRCIARAYLAAEEHEKGASILEDALKLLADRTESLEKALCLIDLGSSFLDQAGEFDDEDEEKAQTLFHLALTLFELAFKIQQPKLGDCQQVLETLDSIGNLHVNLHQHEDAIAVYKDTLSLAMKLRSDNEKIAGILFFLGECYEAIGDYNSAEKQYKQCLMGLKTDRASDDLDLARPMQRLGAISLVKGDYQNARKIYDGILKIREANYEPTNNLLAETLDVLGYLAMRCREYESACTYLLEALKIRKKHDNPRATGDTLFQIGNAYRMLCDNDNALTYLVHSSTTLEGTVDENDPLLGSVALAIGHIELSSGKDEEALEYLEQAVAIRKASLGDDHRKTANACRSLGVVKFLLNQNDEAAALLQDYVHTMDRQPEHRIDTEYVVAQIMLSDIQTARGKHKQAQKALSSAKEVCKGTSTSSEQHQQQPLLQSMVDDRRSVPTPSLLTRMHDRQREEAVVLVHDPQEMNFFRQIVFTDD